MKILIDIGHPAHVHYYRNFIKIMKNNGHEFFVIARNRGVIFKLLAHYNIKYFSRGKGSKSFFGKIVYSIYAIFIVARHALKFKPDIFISQGGLYTSPVAWLLNRTSLSTEDTENARISHKIAKLFQSYILSPSCFEINLGKKHIRYSSYQELFYLYPGYFLPDPDIYKYLDIPLNEKFILIRFVDWNAHHDIGHQGISTENKIKAIREFSKYARIFILSESELPKDLIKYKIKIPPEKMHDVLYYAELLYGESATMASECACLGTPAIFIDNEGRGYTNEEENEYGLVFNFKETLIDQENSIKKAIDLLENNNLKKVWRANHDKMLSEKIDPTKFLVWFVEEFPKSAQILKKNPNYQLIFK